MLDGPGTRSLRRSLCLVLAFAAWAPGVTAAQTWLHPVLPEAVVKAAPPARRGSRAARAVPTVPARPFPTAVSGDSSFVELTTGDRYPEPGRPIPPERIDRSFARLGEGRPMPLTSAKTDGPLTRLEATWTGQGLATLAVLLSPEPRTVEGADFESLLREAGAEPVLSERARKKRSGKSARIVATESARAFAGIVAPPRSTVTADPAEGRDEPLGLPLEIVVGAPPLLLRAGASIPVSVLADGKPAPGAVVRAYLPGGGEPVAVTADERGNASVSLAAAGRVLLSTASVRQTGKADRARGEIWKRAEWEVHRTTLELLVLPKAPAPKPTAAPKRKATPKPKSKPKLR
jgi:hypothetical protein